MRNMIRICLTLALCMSTSAMAHVLPVSKFVQFPEYRKAILSPDGTYLAVVTTQPKHKQRYQLVVLKTSSILSGKLKTTARFKFGERQLLGQVFWVNDHRLAGAPAEYFGGFDHPYLNGALFAINADGSQAKGLMGSDSSGQLGYRTSGSNKLVFYVGLLSHIWQDKNSILVEGFLPSSNVPNAYRLDTLSDRFFRVGTGLYGGGLLADHDGNVRLKWGSGQKTGKPIIKYKPLHSNDWKNITSLVYMDKGTQGEAREIEPTPPIMFGPDNKSFYFPAISANSNFTRGLYSIDPTADSKKLLYSNSDVDVGYAGISNSYIKSLDRRSLVGLRDMPGKINTLVLNGHSAKIQLLAALIQSIRHEQIDITSWTKDGSKAIVKAWGDDQPTAFYLYSAKPKPSLVLLFRATPWITTKDLSPQAPITYKSRDGLTIHGYLTLPRNGPRKKLPLVVYVHGGPYGVRYDWGFDAIDFDSVATQILANHGYAVLAPNYRGSGGYGVKFEDAGYRHWGDTMQDDLADAAKWAIKKGIADPHRICILGGSYGGYAALMSAELFPDLFHCAIGYSGVYDLPLIKSRASEISRYAGGRRWENIVLGSDKKTLREFSPVDNVEKLKAPVLLIHGGRDQIAPVEGYNEMVEAIKKHGTPLETLYERDEGHGFYQPAHRKKAWQDILGFLGKYIGPDAKDVATNGH